MLAQILGWVATTLFTLMYVPQMVMTYRKGSTDNVSLPMFLVGLVGNVIALWYATLIGQAPLIIKYTFAIAAICIYIGIYVVIKRRKNGTGDNSR
jgi:uncharacterized protein with PQ loop repeat